MAEVSAAEASSGGITFLGWLGEERLKVMSCVLALEEVEGEGVEEEEGGKRADCDEKGIGLWA